MPIFKPMSWICFARPSIPFGNLVLSTAIWPSWRPPLTAQQSSTVSGVRKDLDLFYTLNMSWDPHCWCTRSQHLWGPSSRTRWQQRETCPRWYRTCTCSKSSSRETAISPVIVSVRSSQTPAILLPRRISWRWHWCRPLKAKSRVNACSKPLLGCVRLVSGRVVFRKFIRGHELPLMLRKPYKLTCDDDVFLPAH